MKKLFILIVLVTLFGCDKSAKETTSDWVLPDGSRIARFIS